MKLILNLGLFCICMFLYYSCNNIVSPEGELTLNKGQYLGKFSVIYKYSLAKQSGTISILFGDSTYSYSAIADFSSDSTLADSLGDFGRYSFNNGKLIMNDISWWFMSPDTRNSLYLKGTFNILRVGKYMNISQDNSYANWNLEIIEK